MKFEGYKLPRFVMYNGWLIGLMMIIAFVVIRPIFDDRISIVSLFELLFLKSAKLTFLVFGLSCILTQFAGYDCSRTKLKFLEILGDKVIFYLLDGKVLELKYSELSSLEYTNDIYKIFLFTFKDGGKQKISNSIKDHKTAFEMINKKIQEARTQTF